MFSGWNFYISIRYILCGHSQVNWRFLILEFWCGTVLNMVRYGYLNYWNTFISVFTSITFSKGPETLNLLNKLIYYFNLKSSTLIMNHQNLWGLKKVMKCTLKIIFSVQKELPTQTTRKTPKPTQSHFNQLWKSISTQHEIECFSLYSIVWYCMVNVIHINIKN